MWAVAFTMLAVVAAIPEGPTAALTADDAYPAVGQVVRFNASASQAHDAGNGRIVGYNFSFGDGFGTGWQGSPLAEHAYASAGTFAAKVIVVDARGEESTAYATVQPGGAAPPPSGTPDLVPIQAQLAPMSPRVNVSLNLTVVVLNRGATANAATVRAYDVPENTTQRSVASAAVTGPIARSETVSVTLGPFVFTTAGNHTLRVLVTNVTPPETATNDNELDLRVVVLPTVPPPNHGGGGPPFAVTPLALGLGGAAIAAGAGAAFLLLRPRPPGPLEPPPASPPDRSPPPIWPP